MRRVQPCARRLSTFALRCPPGEGEPDCSVQIPWGLDTLVDTGGFDYCCTWIPTSSAASNKWIWDTISKVSPVLLLADLV
jgi:hypothetical protein